MQNDQSQKNDYGEYSTTLDAARAGKLNEESWGQIRKAAVQGDRNAQFLLSFADLRPRTQRKWLRAAAEQGHPEAYYQVYGRYLADGPEPEIVKSAEEGCPKAQCSLGCYYAWQPQRDLVQSRYWYFQSAINGNSTAMYEIGFTILLGEGGSSDPIEALDWLEKSASQDDELSCEEARRLLVDLYTEGLHGVPQNLERAQYWRGKTQPYSWESDD